MKCKCNSDSFRSPVMSSFASPSAIAPLEQELLPWLSLDTIIGMLPSRAVLNQCFMHALRLHSKSLWAKLDQFSRQL